MFGKKRGRSSKVPGSGPSRPGAMAARSMPAALTFTGRSNTIRGVGGRPIRPTASAWGGVKKPTSAKGKGGFGAKLSAVLGLSSSASATAASKTSSSTPRSSGSSGRPGFFGNSRRDKAPRIPRSSAERILTAEQAAVIVKQGEISKARVAALAALTRAHHASSKKTTSVTGAVAKSRGQKSNSLRSQPAPSSGSLLNAAVNDAVLNPLPAPLSPKLNQPTGALPNTSPQPAKEAEKEAKKLRSQILASAGPGAQVAAGVFANALDPAVSGRVLNPKTALRPLWSESQPEQEGGQELHGGSGLGSTAGGVERVSRSESSTRSTLEAELLAEAAVIEKQAAEGEFAPALAKANFSSWDDSATALAGYHNEDEDTDMGEPDSDDEDDQVSDAPVATNPYHDPTAEWDGDEEFIEGNYSGIIQAMFGYNAAAASQAEARAEAVAPAGRPTGKLWGSGAKDRVDRAPESFADLEREEMRTALLGAQEDAEELERAAKARVTLYNLQKKELAIQEGKGYWQDETKRALALADVRMKIANVERQGYGLD